jgi:pimeloyl-ACP methyl ester carboxylesterase
LEAINVGIFDSQDGHKHDSNGKTGGNYISIGGDSLFYEQSGDPKSDITLVFIHGAFINGNTMKFLSKEMKSYNCVTIDLPGHGKSEGAARNTVAGYTDAVEQLIKVLREKKIIGAKFTLIGWSMGGSISLELAERHIDGLISVVLLDSSAKWYIDLSGIDPTAKIDLRPLFAREFTSLTPDKLKEEFLSNYDKYVSCDATIMSDAMVGSNYDAISELGKVKVPVLAISGDSDYLALPEYEIILKNNINQCYLKMYPNRGHLLFMEIPDVISRDITEFFEYAK